MEVNVIQSQSYLPIANLSVVALVEGFMAFHALHYDEVSIHFVDSEAISQLHSQYFDDPSPTDCISFPLDDSQAEGYRVMGDIFVCPEVGGHYANRHEGDVYQEITLYVVHGLLHLIGYDDVDAQERQAMRKAEKVFLKEVTSKALWLHA